MRPGHELGAGDRAHGPRWPARSSTCDGYEWTELAYCKSRQARRRSSFRWPSLRVPGAGGAVRELVAAAGSDPGRADVLLLFGGWSESGDMDVNIFTQIGFVVLVGLASKNAILIVEFAKQCQDEGVERRDATLQAAAQAAADSDDVVRIYLRRRAAGVRVRRRRGNAPAWGWPCSAACSASLCSAFFSRPFSSTPFDDVTDPRSPSRRRNPPRRN